MFVKHVSNEVANSHQPIRASQEIIYLRKISAKKLDRAKAGETKCVTQRPSRTFVITMAQLSPCMLYTYEDDNYNEIIFIAK